MAVYKILSIRFPFRVGYLMMEEAKQRRIGVGTIVVEAMMKRYADRLKDWRPHDERKMRDLLTMGGKPDGKEQSKQRG